MFAPVALMQTSLARRRSSWKRRRGGAVGTSISRPWMWRRQVSSTSPRVNGRKAGILGDALHGVTSPKSPALEPLHKINQNAARGFKAKNGESRTRCRIWCWSHVACALECWATRAGRRRWCRPRSLQRRCQQSSPGAGPLRPAEIQSPLRRPTIPRDHPHAGFKFNFCIIKPGKIKINYLLFVKL